MERVLAAFREDDTLGEGSISVDCFVDLLTSLNPGITERDAHLLVREGSWNKDGKVYYEDFIKWLTEDIQKGSAGGNRDETSLVKRKEAWLAEQLVIDSFPVSQPCRSILLLLALGKIPFTLNNIDLISGKRSENPHQGFVPYMRDLYHGVEMGEGAAILVHLCETRGLKDYYPTDVKRRALCHYWMHWHHTGSRQGTLQLFRAFLIPDLDAEEGVKAVLPHFKFLNDALESQGTRFLTGDSVTIADLLLLPEVDQLDLVADALIGDGLFPYLEKWLAEMKKIPEYEGNVAAMKAMSAQLGLDKAIGALAKGMGKDKISRIWKVLEAGVQSAADHDGDGKVSSVEFKRYLMTL